MRLMLIRPPFAAEKFYGHNPEEPMGVEYLASFLAKKHDVGVVDAVAESWNNYWQSAEFPDLVFYGLGLEKLQQRIADFKPQVIGLSWLFTTQDPSINIVLKAIRAFNKEVKIIVGGPQPSNSPREILANYRDIDAVVFGEGEMTLLELLDNQLKDLDKIHGLAFRKGKEVVVNEPRELIKDLDILPYPLRNPEFYKNYSKLIFNEFLNYRLRSRINSEQIRRQAVYWADKIPLADELYYLLHNSKKDVNKLPYADMLTSRGCPNHCTFCAVHNLWGHHWRARSAANVLGEIETLIREFGIKHINFIDDNFNISRERVIEICKGIIDNNYDLTLAATSGIYVPTLDEEVLTWLKRAGINTLRMSIESGNQEILNSVIRKNINLKQVVEIVKICKKLSIKTEGAFILGLPGETLETMQDTVNFANSTGFDHVIKFIYQPFPHTELYELCLKKGFLTPDFDPKRSYVTGEQCYVKTDKFMPEDVRKIARKIGRKE